MSGIEENVIKLKLLLVHSKKKQLINYLVVFKKNGAQIVFGQ